MVRSFKKRNKTTLESNFQKEKKKSHCVEKHGKKRNPEKVTLTYQTRNT
jgi:hypothetical protein